MKKLVVCILLVFPTVFGIAAVKAGEHQLFDQVLSDHVSDGQVDYPAIAGDARFGDYLDYLAEANPQDFESRDEQLAFWINAYNALAIKGILDGLTPSGFFSRFGFFNEEFQLAGREIDLYDLERDIIIPFAEPRIHFAIVCASASCPKLTEFAYTADQLDRQLEQSTREFVNDRTRNRFDPNTLSASISKIFDWFPDDFNNHSGTVQQYLARYVDDPVIADALSRNEYYLRFMDYDWSLNGRQPG